MNHVQNENVSFLKYKIKPVTKKTVAFLMIIIFSKNNQNHICFG